MNDLPPLEKIVVPQGGVATLQLQVVPPMKSPSPGVEPWTIIGPNGQAVDPNSLSIEFNSQSTNYERMRERAILMVTLSTAGGAKEERFKFFGAGLEYATDMEDLNDDVDTSVTKDGQTLVFTIQNQGMSSSTIDFGFLISRLNKNTRELTIFEGPDPLLVIRR